MLLFSYSRTFTVAGRAIVLHCCKTHSNINRKMDQSSAVAEMGDRSHNRYGPKRGGCCAPYAIRYDTMIFTCTQKLTYSQLNLPHGTKEKIIMKKLKIKTEMLKRNGPVISHKAVESVLRPEGSLWWERFVKTVGLEPGVKERGSYAWWEWWVERVRRCGRSMSRQVRDRGTGMRLTERTRKLIPETWWGIPEGAISYA